MDTTLDRIVEVDIVVRVDGHRMCFRAERTRLGTRPEALAATREEAGTAIRNATGEALAFIGRAYPQDAP